MKLHTNTITKPRHANANDVQNTLNIFALIGNLLTQLNTFVGGIKSQASS